MILKNIKSVFLSNIVIQIVGFISGFILKRLIAPSLMGIWNLVNLMTSYIQMFSLGTAGGLQREMPYYLGSGNLEMEKKLRETHLAVVYIEVGLSTFLFLLFFLIKGNFWLENFWFLYLLAPFYALFNRAYSFIMNCFQARQQFVELSKINVCVSFVNVGLTVLGAWFFGLPGLFVGFTLLYIYRIWLGIVVAKRFGLHFSARFHPEVFKELFKVGFPLQIGGYLWGIFVTIDSILVAKWLGVTQLAFYAMGVGYKNQLGEFPTQVNNIFFQRIMNKYGKEKTLKSISKDVMAFFQGNLLVVVPFVCLAGVFVLPFLIRSFINNYSPAIPSIIILLFGMFFAPQADILMNLLTLKKSFKMLIFVSVLALGINVVSICLFNAWEPGITNVALGVLVGNAAFFVILLLIATPGVLSGVEKIRVILYQYLAFLFTVVIFLVLEQVFPVSGIFGTDLMRTFFKFGLSLLCCIPIAIYGLVISDAWHKVKEEIFSIFNGFALRFSMTKSEDI